jgi:hypothetical protein
MRAALAVVFAMSLAAASLAQRLPSQPSAAYNAASATGLFELVIYVDGDNYISVRGNEIAYQVQSGGLPRDTGSNYNQPIPRAMFGTFNMVKVAGRGSVELVEEPGPGNDYTALLRIIDSRAGRDLYHVRLEWTWNPADPSRPPGPRGGEAVRGNVGNPATYDRDRQGEFLFRGRVDGVTAFYIRSDQVRTQVFSGSPSRGETFAFSQPLPFRPLATFDILDVGGRGRVELVERPWEGNDYTAVVRIQDDARGSADYQFRLVWMRQD